MDSIQLLVKFGTRGITAFVTRNPSDVNMTQEWQIERKYSFNQNVGNPNGSP
jgi:hypothetical protein